MTPSLLIDWTFAIVGSVGIIFVLGAFIYATIKFLKCP